MRINHFVSVQTIWALETLAGQFQRTQGKEQEGHPVANSQGDYDVRDYATGNRLDRATLHAPAVIESLDMFAGSRKTGGT